MFITSSMRGDGYTSGTKDNLSFTSAVKKFDIVMRFFFQNIFKYVRISDY